MEKIFEQTENLLIEDSKRKVIELQCETGRALLKKIGIRIYWEATGKIKEMREERKETCRTL